MIKATPQGYVIYSRKTGRKLSRPYRTMAEALKREDEIRRIKHMKIRR